MRIKPIFAWYDFWIGAYYDQTKSRLYLFPVPCLGLWIEMDKRGTEKVGVCASCGAKDLRVVLDAGERRTIGHRAGCRLPKTKEGADR